ncbi:MAG: TIGR04255 family protein [Sulfuricurvum sp.]
MVNKNNSIVEAVVDIFFETTTFTEIFLNIILGIDGFDVMTKLPMSQIPEAIRTNDPNLRFQPLYEIHSNTNKDYKVMLGDGTVGIAINGEYKGWEDSFYPQIQRVFQTILESQKITKINRIGMRYINFFPHENIFETGKVKVTIDNHEANTKAMFLKIDDSVEDISYSKTITNDQNYLNREEGSIIDIVTFAENDSISSDNNSVFDTINQLHTLSKDKFKEVVNDEYISTHNL